MQNKPLLVQILETRVTKLQLIKTKCRDRYAEQLQKLLFGLFSIEAHLNPIK